jgi:hypothetical protein
MCSFIALLKNERQNLSDKVIDLSKALAAPTGVETHSNGRNSSGRNSKWQSADYYDRYVARRGPRRARYGAAVPESLSNSKKFHSTRVAVLFRRPLLLVRQTREWGPFLPALSGNSASAARARNAFRFSGSR